jgi:MerR family redox-sensitive transcriptional activator SoxR
VKELTIGELARRAGVQTSAIRYYERVGLLPPPKRVNGRRRYPDQTLKRLGMIQLARQAGFRIRELQVLFAESPADSPVSLRWQSLAKNKMAELDAMIVRAQSIKAWLRQAEQCRCTHIEDCATVSLSWGGKTPER